MSAYAEQPFSDFEERYFLAEILKRSNLAPGHLFAIIRDNRIDPAWNDIALPHGRSVSACQQAYQSLSARLAALPPPPPPPPLSAVGPIDPSRGTKRPYASLGDATNPVPRELQPRPPGYPGVNGQGILFPQPSPMTPVAPQRKKRGRPTKAEWERRQAEAQERGEIWPKPRKAKARPSMETGESSKSATREVALAAMGSEAASGSGAAVAPTPSPDASRSASGGPVQPQAGATRGPEGPGNTPPPAAPERPGDIRHPHAQSAAPKQPPPSPYASSRVQLPPGERQRSPTPPAQRSPYPGHFTPKGN